MSTYQQSSHPGPLDPSQPNRRRPRRDPLAPQPDYFRRRLALIAVAGALIAPVALALRGDGQGVSSSSTPGAAVLTQIDGTSAETQPSLATDPTTTAPTTLPIAAPPSTVASRTCASIYVVLPGDSWYGIADRAGVAPGLIAGSNNVTIREPLVPGDELCLPAGVSVAPPVPPAENDADTSSQQDPSAPRCGLDYVVQPGDSWYGIASRAGVKAGPLAAVNGKTLSSPLKVGQTICLPEGARRPPTTTTTTRPPQTSGAPSGAQTSANDMRQVPYNPSRLYSRDEVEQIVRTVWPDHLENDALYVVQRESRFNPGSRSRCCIGLFQINWSSHKRWMANYGVTNPAQLLDPEVNARMALVTWERSGSWRPWCTSSWCPPT
jgi:LysM repeat protein